MSRVFGPNKVFAKERGYDTAGELERVEAKGLQAEAEKGQRAAAAEEAGRGTKWEGEKEEEEGF